MKRVLAIVCMALLLVAALFPVAEAQAGRHHRRGGCYGGSCYGGGYGGGCYGGSCYGGAGYGGGYYGGPGYSAGYAPGYIPYGYPAMGYATYPQLGH
jgi:hypothetical protein